MLHYPTMAATQTETEIQLDMETRMSLQSYQAEERQMTLHITYHSSDIRDRIRIWPSTYLVSKEGPSKVEIIHAENIGIYPHWKIITADKPHIFTLVFSALPKDCTTFDLLEDIPEPGGFFIPDIKRNRSDIYHLHMYG